MWSRIVDEVPDAAARQSVATKYGIDCHHVPGVLFRNGGHWPTGVFRRHRRISSGCTSATSAATRC